MGRYTEFHLNKDCSELKRQIDRNANLSLGERSIAPDRRAVGDVTAYDVGSDLCNYCGYEAKRDGLIEDFNSVWFGLGPDFCTRPRWAGVIPQGLTATIPSC